MKNKKFIITGGCGFIGSHLVEFLVSVGAEVIVIDNLCTGKQENLSNSDNVKIIFDNVENINFNKFSNVDGVFHLAAQASVPISIKEIYNSSSINILSSLKAIEFCNKYSIPLIYTSSSAVYGNIKYGEEDGDFELLSPYAVDKYALEKYVEVSRETHNLKSFGLRLYNVYGPRQDPLSPYSGVISIFLKKILNNEKIIINGGYQTRDFIYVNDIVKALISAYNKICNEQVGISLVSNVLTGISITIDDLVLKIEEILEKRYHKEYAELHLSDPVVSSGSTITMGKLLNLKNLTILDHGLRETINWFIINHEK